MFVVMAFVNLNPGKEEELVNRMRSFRNLLQTKSGLVKTFVLMERGGRELVGVSIVDRRDRVSRRHGEYAGITAMSASRSVERQSMDDE